MMRATVLLAGLFSLAGCGFDVTQFGGHDYTEHHGVLVVDGTPLPNKRWVAVDVPVGTGSLELGSATADIVLSGSPDGASHLEVQLFSEVEGDGSVRVDGGRLVTSSAANRLVIVNGARGTLARGMKLELHSGTGDLRLEGLPELSEVSLDNGTGDVRLTQCATGDVVVVTGTGEVHLDGLKGGKLDVKTGTGEAGLASCSVSMMKLETGTGDVTLSECTSTRTDVKSGTGDVILEGQNVLGTTSYELGTGKVRNR
jgi:hypothetical protein